MADRIMNGLTKGGLKRLLWPNYIGKFLIEMRYASYYKHRKGLLNKFFFIVHYASYRKLGMKLGFSIGCDTLGYGVKIPHYGTIVVGESNRIGNYAVLHTSTCITDNGKIIGDGLYLSTGVKITSKVRLGNNISIGANSLVNKDCEQDNVLLGGMPAKIIRKEETWYIRDSFEEKIKKIEEMKQNYGL